MSVAASKRGGPTSLAIHSPLSKQIIHQNLLSISQTYELIECTLQLPDCFNFWQMRATLRFPREAQSEITFHKTVSLLYRLKGKAGDKKAG